MGFEESALARLRRYRGEADRALGLMQEAEEATQRFSELLFDGLERTAALGREAGFDADAGRTDRTLALRVAASCGEEARVVFGPVGGAAAETDEDLMHEELSRYVLDPSGYSGRILGFSEVVGEAPSQVFAVYRDGVWKTKGAFVEKARGRIDDPEEVLHGFSLRVLGRLVDLAAPTSGAGRRWTERPYALDDLLAGRRFPTETRWFR
ncbi:MAG TPA: hypothetical protein VK869_13185 [Rubrobacteraceae bacterium]|nr:hypothetical protein [Rubrobacteraceae bacterium]